MLTVSTLTPDHRGHPATVGRFTGTLAWARNRAYPRRIVSHWWLMVPASPALPMGAAVSLQWAGDKPVELQGDA